MSFFRNQPISRGLVSIAFAHLAFLSQWVDLLEYSSSWSFEAVSSFPASYAVLLISEAAVAALLYFSLGLAKSKTAKIWYLIPGLLFSTCIFLCLNEIRTQLTESSLISVGTWGTKKLAGVALAGLLATILLTKFVRPWNFLVRLASLAAVPFLIYCWGTAIYRTSYLWISESMQESGSRVVSKSDSPQRVLWIVFDMWDYSLTFNSDNFTPLPHLAEFQKSAFFATAVQPPASWTSLSLASSITGKSVKNWSYPAGIPHFALKFCEEEKTALVKETPNLFSIAKQNGLTTAVVGWHLPYCQAFSPHLDYCSRYPLYRKGNRKQEANVASAFLQLFREVATIRKSSPVAHFEHIQDIAKEAVKVAGDKNYSFSLLHLPMPHDPYLYDSEKDQFTLHSPRALGYRDNLKLMDKTLGQIKAEMKKNHLWNDTLVIVTSDHSASRIKLNENGERVLVLSDHSRHIVPKADEVSLDTRVPLLIKFPGQTEKMTYAGKTNSILVYDLLKSVWSKEIKSPEKLGEWFDTQLPKSEKATACFQAFKVGGNLP